RQKGFTDKQILRLLNNQDEMTARGPMQWDSTQYRGFSKEKPWNWALVDSNNVDQEIADPDSIMNFYRELLKIKKHDCFTSGDYRLLITDSNIYAYQRKTADKQGIVIANFSDQKAEFTLPKNVWRKVLANESSEVEDGVVKLGPWGCCAFESN